ncbi:MAG: DUF3261 domain-containing protein [Azoarcus sp.]|jgi:hypothetical protein|nr:DUF3261 domain-containing protein [Azoarcus sp.]
MSQATSLSVAVPTNVNTEHVAFSSARIPLAIILLTALILPACASFWLSGDLPLLRIAPETLGTRTVEQRASVAWPGGQRALEMVVDVDGGTMVVIGMAFGTRLFSLVYDGKKITETQPPPGGLSATRIANDLLLAYAPLDALLAALPAGWTAREEPGARQVFRDGTPAISIHYAESSPWTGRVLFNNHALRYQLTLDSHEAEADSDAQ